MLIALLIPDNWKKFRKYHLKDPYFGTAPTALLVGFSMLNQAEKQRILRHHYECMADIEAASRFRIGSFRTSNLPNHEKQIFYWHSGRAFRAYLHPEGGILDEEVAYIHFQKRRFPEPPSGILDSPGMGIGPQGFFPYDREPLSLHDFSRMNPDLPKPWGVIFSQEAQRIGNKIRRVMQSSVVY
jgi:hypothetical protein